MTRYMLSIGAAAALLAACGTSQPPLAAPNALPPSRQTSTWSYAVEYRFLSYRGVHPEGGLVDVGGTLYGTTVRGGPYRGGTVYGITRRGAATVIHSFGEGGDGAQPRGGLLDANGTLYGTTQKGGAHGAGTVFSITTSGSEKVLYSFAGGSDGATPVGDLIEVNGTLYGATNEGGGACLYSLGCGTVYSLSTSGGERVLHTFGGKPDGAFPRAGLIDVNGTLYGTASSGGSSCNNFYSPCGVVYSISTSGSEKVIYSFKGGSDGSLPSAALIAVKNKLYGTTLFGGGTGCDLVSQKLGCGVVYSITPTGAEKVVHRFCVGTDSDGANPWSPLTDVKGTLYGTASGNGVCSHYQNGPGTIYSVTTAGAENLLYAFHGEPSGLEPSSGVIGVNGVLYGTTGFGGRGCGHGYNYSGCGVVYALSQ